MRRLLIALCACGLVSGCGPPTLAEPTPVGPPAVTPVPPPPGPSPIRGTPITIGEEFRGLLTAHGTENILEVTAGSDGMLAVSVTWDPRLGRIEVWVGDEMFGQHTQDRITGLLPVLSGEKYLLRVRDGAPWDYDDLSLPFVLSTSLSR
jgi:hypothetical protein